MEGAAHGGGGVPIPGGVQGMPGHGIQCSGLGDKAGIRHWLDSMILVFSNLNNSVVIWLFLISRNMIIIVLNHEICVHTYKISVCIEVTCLGEPKMVLMHF